MLKQWESYFTLHYYLDKVFLQKGLVAQFALGLFLQNLLNTNFYAIKPGDLEDLNEQIRNKLPLRQFIMFNMRFTIDFVVANLDAILVFEQHF